MSPVVIKKAFDLRVTDTLTDEFRDYVLNRKSTLGQPAQSIPPMRISAEEATTGMSPGQSLTVAGGVYTVRDVRGLFLIPVDDFAAGEGQPSYDTNDAAPNRFMTSRFIDCSVPGEISIGMDRAVFPSADVGDSLEMQAAGDYVFISGKAVSGMPLMRIDPSNGSIAACTGLEADLPISGLTYDGHYIYAAQTSPDSVDDGAVYRTTPDSLAFDPWSDQIKITSMIAGPGLIYAVRANYNDEGTLVTQAGILGPTSFTAQTASSNVVAPSAPNRGLARAQNECFWLLGDGEYSVVYAFSPAAGSLRLAYSLPDGFHATCIEGYLDCVYIGGYYLDDDNHATGTIYVGDGSNSVTKLTDIMPNADHPGDTSMIRGLKGHRRHIYVLTDHNFYRWNVKYGGLSHVCPASAPADNVIVVPEGMRQVTKGSGQTLQAFGFSRSLTACAAKNVKDSVSGGVVNIVTDIAKAQVNYHRDVPGMENTSTFQLGTSKGLYTTGKIDKKNAKLVNGAIHGNGLYYEVAGGGTSFVIRAHCTVPTHTAEKDAKGKKTGWLKESATQIWDYGTWDAGIGNWRWSELFRCDAVVANTITSVKHGNYVDHYVNGQVCGRCSVMRPNDTPGIDLQVGPAQGSTQTSMVRLARMYWCENYAVTHVAPTGDVTRTEVYSIAGYHGQIWAPDAAGYMCTTPTVRHNNPGLGTTGEGAYLRLSSSTFHMNGVDKGFYAIWVDHSPLVQGEQNIKLTYSLDGAQAIPVGEADVLEADVRRSLFLVQDNGNRIQPTVELVDPSASKREDVDRLRVFAITSAFLVPSIRSYVFNILGYDNTEDRSGGIWDEPADMAIDFLFELAGLGRVVNIDLGFDSFLGIIKAIDELPTSAQEADTAAHQGVVQMKVQRL